MARVLPFSRRKAKGPELVDVFMLHTTVGDDRPAIVARARLPIADARSQMGARGFYVNFLINWPFIMSCGIGVLFIVWEVALLMIGGITNPAAMLPYLIGSGAIGAGMGYALGKLTHGFIVMYAPEKSYAAWAEWTPPKVDSDGNVIERGFNTITPMEFERASMLDMNTKEQQAYLQAVGIEATKPPRKEGESTLETQIHLTGSTPVFTAKGFANALQVDTATRILRRSGGKEGFAKTASIALIALAFFAIAAVLGISEFGGSSDDEAPKQTENQDISDARLP